MQLKPFGEWVSIFIDWLNQSIIINGLLLIILIAINDWFLLIDIAGCVSSHVILRPLTLVFRDLNIICLISSNISRTANTLWWFEVIIWRSGYLLIHLKMFFFTLIFSICALSLTRRGQLILTLFVPFRLKGEIT